jgi:hypothetical protein
MNLKDSQLIDIIENIPSIEASLTWIYNEGEGSFEKEIEADAFIVSTNFSCFETGTSDAGDYTTPPSFISSGLDVFDVEVNIFDQDGEELNLSIQQKESIIQSIKSSIISI